MASEPIPPQQRRNVWVNRAILVVVLGLPISVFVGLQVFAAYTRSGNVDEVWFADTAQGPRLIGREQVLTGTKDQPKLRERLVLVDLATGERVARERVEVPLRFVEADPDGLWFCEKHGCADVHARDANTLERKTVARQPRFEAEGRAEDPFASAVQLAGARLEVSVGEGGAGSLGSFHDAAFLRDELTRAPIVLDGKSALVVHRPPEDPHNTLLVSRIGADQRPVWTAKLERQRAIRAAHLVGDSVVIVTSGVARDFAISVDLATGKTRWVHYF